MLERDARLLYQLSMRFECIAEALAILDGFGIDRVAVRPDQIERREDAAQIRSFELHVRTAREIGDLARDLPRRRRKGAGV